MLNERLLGEAIRKGIAKAVNPLKSRIETLEEMNTLSVQRRVVDAQLIGALIYKLSEQSNTKRSELKSAIRSIARNMQKNTEDDWELNRLIEEHAADWIERLD